MSDFELGPMELDKIKLPAIAKPLCESALSIARQLSAFRTNESLDHNSPLVAGLMALASGLNTAAQQDVIKYSNDILAMLMNRESAANVADRYQSDNAWNSVLEELDKNEIELIAALAMPGVITSAIQQIADAEERFLIRCTPESYGEFTVLTNDAIASLNEVHRVAFRVLPNINN